MASKLNPQHNQLPAFQATAKPAKLRASATQIKFSAATPPDQQISTTSKPKLAPEPLTVEFKTLGACKLGISRYPDFTYNAEKGRGDGLATVTENENVSVSFDPRTLYIPPLTSATTKFLGLPLPPFLKIDIVPELLQGNINRQSGKVELEFKAKFLFTAGGFYRAPPLLVAALLTSEESVGQLRGGRGERLNEQGACKLVGVATVDAVDDLFMDTFLSLPTECLASLNASICFTS
uniref:Uncharacterized protein n=1 Tax=Kalanchoe fedtschenkoi TaxID=63787 RepID=A0A7N0URG6_KALFE